MENEIALSNTLSYLNIKRFDSLNPLARKIIPDTISNTKYNVILILMESMSAVKMGRFGDKNGLTPFLDSLTYQSLFFDSFYSAGIHTHNGIFSSVHAFPALFSQHPLKKMYHYNGMATTLKQNGYNTVYFTTHDGQFDNVEGFLKMNDVIDVYTKSDYPSNEIKSTLGVPDDYMFRFSIPVINKLFSKNKPFFITFMTASDHYPRYVPDYYKPQSKPEEQQTIEYADWSIQQFFKAAQKTEWFENTLFVLVADHGHFQSDLYDISLDYHHIPAIFYNPKLVPTETRHDIGGQIDLFPTIMGILKQPYINNTLGIDLLKQKRPYIYFSSDDKLGVLDHEHFLVQLKDQDPKLFLYKNQDKNNLYIPNKVKADSMALYAKSQLQTYQYLLNNNKLYFSDE